MNLKNIYPICVSISESSPEMATKLVRKYPFVEIRFDAAAYSIHDLKKIIRQADSCIVTCRPQAYLANNCHYSEDQRKALLTAALEFKPDFIDIEVESDSKFKKEIIKKARQKKVKVIVSLHDFRCTPALRQLENEIKKAQKFGADIVKIATLVSKSSDTKILLSLLSRHKNLVIIGMGEKGKSLRLAAPLLGSLFTFVAPSAGKETAPGQLLFNDVKNVYKKLGVLKK